jgi:hypothetical protein
VLAAHLRGISLDEAARALKDHAVLAGTPVIEVARDLIVHRPVIRPRVLMPVTDLDWWAGDGSRKPRTVRCPDPHPKDEHAAEQLRGAALPVVRNLDAAWPVVDRGGAGSS